MRAAAVHDDAKWDASLDRLHTKALQELVTAFGWPTISRVGADASVAAWLLVQHADENLAFQKLCLQLMKSEPLTEVQQWNIALLEDRILVSEGKLQIYGSQFHKDKSTGKMIPWPIADAAQLDSRRKQVGLRPFEQEVAAMRLFE